MVCTDAHGFPSTLHFSLNARNADLSLADLSTSPQARVLRSMPGRVVEARDDMPNVQKSGKTLQITRRA
jgi:hypothetical protein